MPQFDMDKIIDVMKRETLRGIAGEFINDPENDIMAIKTKLLTEEYLLTILLPT